MARDRGLVPWLIRCSAIQRRMHSLSWSWAFKLGYATIFNAGQEGRLGASPPDACYGVFRLTVW